MNTMFLYNTSYLLIIPALIFASIAQVKVSSAFRKYSKIQAVSGKKGSEVARLLLDSYGAHNVQIMRVKGNLTDHYDPKNKVLKLSDKVHDSSSLSAIGVAAHEAGHALQDAESYGPLVLRTSIYPISSAGSMLSFVLIFLGFFLGTSILINIGIVFFSASVFFTLVTLPVEFDASKRALALISQHGIVIGDELKGCKKVLDAAAMTYVAAALTSLLELARLIIIAKSDD